MTVSVDPVQDGHENNTLCRLWILRSGGPADNGTVRTDLSPCL